MSMAKRRWNAGLVNWRATLARKAIAPTPSPPTDSYHRREGIPGLTASSTTRSKRAPPTTTPTKTTLRSTLWLASPLAAGGDGAVTTWMLAIRSRWCPRAS